MKTDPFSLDLPQRLDSKTGVKYIEQLYVRVFDIVIQAILQRRVCRVAEENCSFLSGPDHRKTRRRNSRG